MFRAVEPTTPEFPIAHSHTTPLIIDYWFARKNKQRTKLGLPAPPPAASAMPSLLPSYPWPSVASMLRESREGRRLRWGGFRGGASHLRGEFCFYTPLESTEDYRNNA
jgi:hypothetical protein